MTPQAEKILIEIVKCCQKYGCTYCDKGLNEPLTKNLRTFATCWECQRKGVK